MCRKPPKFPLIGQAEHQVALNLPARACSCALHCNPATTQPLHPSFSAMGQQLCRVSHELADALRAWDLLALTSLTRRLRAAKIYAHRQTSITYQQYLNLFTDTRLAASQGLVLQAPARLYFGLDRMQQNEVHIDAVLAAIMMFACLPAYDPLAAAGDSSQGSRPATAGLPGSDACSAGAPSSPAAAGAPNTLPEAQRAAMIHSIFIAPASDPAQAMSNLVRHAAQVAAEVRYIPRRLEPTEVNLATQALLQLMDYAGHGSTLPVESLQHLFTAQAKHAVHHVFTRAYFPVGQFTPKTTMARNYPVTPRSVSWKDSSASWEARHAAVTCAAELRGAGTDAMRRYYRAWLGKQRLQRETNMHAAQRVVRETQLNMRDVVRLRDAFAAALEGRRALDRPAFHALMLDQFPSLKNDAGLDHMFDMFDRDGDTIIDFREFCLGVARMCSGNLEEKVDFIFTVYDEDGDNTMSTAELTRFLHQRGEELHAVFAQAQSIMQAVAGEGHGSIPRAAFIDSVQQNPNLLQCFAFLTHHPLRVELRAQVQRLANACQMDGVQHNLTASSVLELWDTAITQYRLVKEHPECLLDALMASTRAQLQRVQAKAPPGVDGAGAGGAPSCGRPQRLPRGRSRGSVFAAVPGAVQVGTEGSAPPEQVTLPVFMSICIHCLGVPGDTSQEVQEIFRLMQRLYNQAVVPLFAVLQELALATARSVRERARSLFRIVDANNNGEAAAGEVLKLLLDHQHAADQSMDELSELLLLSSEEQPLTKARLLAAVRDQPSLMNALTVLLGAEGIAAGVVESAAPTPAASLSPRVPSSAHDGQCTHRSHAAGSSLATARSSVHLTHLSARPATAGVPVRRPFSAAARPSTGTFFFVPTTVSLASHTSFPNLARAGGPGAPAGSAMPAVRRRARSAQISRGAAQPGAVFGMTLAEQSVVDVGMSQYRYAAENAKVRRKGVRIAAMQLESKIAGNHARIREASKRYLPAVDKFLRKAGEWQRPQSEHAAVRRSGAMALKRPGAWRPATAQHWRAGQTKPRSGAPRSSTRGKAGITTSSKTCLRVRQPRVQGADVFLAKDVAFAAAQELAQPSSLTMEQSRAKGDHSTAVPSTLQVSTGLDLPPTLLVPDLQAAGSPLAAGRSGRRSPSSRSPPGLTPSMKASRRELTWHMSPPRPASVYSATPSHRQPTPHEEFEFGFDRVKSGPLSMSHAMHKVSNVL